MDVLERGIAFGVGLVCNLSEVECVIWKVNDLFIGFNGDFQTVLFEDLANAFLKVFCCPLCPVESYIMFRFLTTLGEEGAAH